MNCHRGCHPWFGSLNRHQGRPGLPFDSHNVHHDPFPVERQGEPLVRAGQAIEQKAADDAVAVSGRKNRNQVFIEIDRPLAGNPGDEVLHRGTDVVRVGPSPSADPSEPSLLGFTQRPSFGMQQEAKFSIYSLARQPQLNKFTKEKGRSMLQPK